MKTITGHRMKLSRYITLTAMMLVLLVIFVFLGSAPSMLFEQYGAGGTGALTRSDVRPGTDARRVAIVGAEGDASAVRELCYYNKIAVTTHPTVADAAGADIAVLAADTDWEQQADAIGALLAAGTNVVFAGLPDGAALRQSPRLMQLLGVRDVRGDSVTTDGLKLFSGVLLGGEAVYEDYPVTLCWPTLAAGCKVYMVGLFDEKGTLTNEELPPVFWRSRAGSAFVYVMQGGYLDTPEGMGFFSFLLCDEAGVSLYPVINAQTMLVQNFPSFYDENDAEMDALYSRKSTAFFQNTVMPSLVMINQATNTPMTWFFTTCYDERLLGTQTPDGDQLSFYISQILRYRGELAVAGSTHVEQDVRFLRSVNRLLTVVSFDPQQMASGAYAELLEHNALFAEVKTVVAPDLSTRFSFYDEDTLLFPATGTVRTHTSRQDLAMRSIYTALGVSNLTVDLRDVVYPASGADNWKNVAKEWGEITSTYYKPFDCFDKLTVSDAGERVRAMLALSYTAVDRGDRLEVTVDGFSGAAYFIFRSDRYTLKEADGGVFTAVSGGSYLVRADQPTLTLFYEPGEVYSFQ